MSMSKGVRTLGPAASVEFGASGGARQDRRRHRESPKRRLFASTSSATKFPGMPGAPFTWTKAGFEREIGFGGFEHLAAPSSPCRRRSRSVGTIAFVGKANAKMVDESGFPDHGKISLIARFNSLQGRQKFPVRRRRELARKALI